MKKVSIVFSMFLILFLLVASLPAFAAEEKPDVAGVYSVKGSIKFFDWTSKYACQLKNAYWEITQDPANPDKLTCEMYVTKPMCGIPSHYAGSVHCNNDGMAGDQFFLVGDAGYVGPIERNAAGNISNTPRISQTLETVILSGPNFCGKFCSYSSMAGDAFFITLTINGRVYLNADASVRKIVGSIKGWGEFGPARDVEGIIDPLKPSLGQIEGNFTATCVSGACMP